MVAMGTGLDVEIGKNVASQSSSTLAGSCRESACMHDWYHAVRGAMPRAFFQSSLPLVTVARLVRDCERGCDTVLMMRGMRGMLLSWSGVYLSVVIEAA